MNSILRYVVLPWQQLSGMGNWSYAVLTEWVDRGVVTQGSSEPVIFNSKGAANAHARNEATAWPYRSEACYLTDNGKLIPL